MSGGQKSRINLARAVYSKADIYLLDDPLSAVDINVSNHIFYNLIGPSGLLRNKTRIFITNSLNYLEVVDSVIFLEDGQITEFGTYKDLMEKKGSLSKFININKSNERHIESKYNFMINY